MFRWSKPPRIVGHRGSPRLAVENTMASFRACVDAGVPAFELDARLTADDVVIVHHDAELGRALPGAGAIEMLASDAVRRAGAPTLAEVLAEFPDALVDLELKADALNTDRLPAAAFDVVERAGALDRVLATSFDPETADAYARISGRPAGAICAFPPEADDLADWPRLTHLAIATDAIEPDVAKLGRTVLAWTVNDTRTARRLLAGGVASVITDRPEWLAATVSGDAPAR